jgi:hypothetical protein
MAVMDAVGSVTQEQLSRHEGHEEKYKLRVLRVFVVKIF